MLIICWLQERAELMREEYDRLPKDVDRTLYTDRIMDIVKNVKKQQQEISKVGPFFFTLPRHETNIA